MINSIVTELWWPNDSSKSRLWRHVKFGVFKYLSKAHFELFFHVLLALVICHKTRYDQISIISYRSPNLTQKVNFPIFGTYPYFEFLPRLQILNIQFLMYISTHKHHLSRYSALLKCRDCFVLTQYFLHFSRFGQYRLSLRAIILIIARNNKK